MSEFGEAVTFFRTSKAELLLLQAMAFDVKTHCGDSWLHFILLLPGGN